MKLDGILLLDHDNIPFDRIALYQLIHIWLDAIAERTTLPPVLTIAVRAYGGWYQEDITTEARYRAAAVYADECPSLLMHRSRYCRLTFEFADELLDPRIQSARDRRSPKVTNTVIARGSSPFFSRKPNAPECHESDCQLRAIRTWMRRRRACTRPGCPHAFDSQFQRFEQKQVDIHLASDLITLSESANTSLQIGIVTDDSDLLPAVAAAGMRIRGNMSVTLLRCLTDCSYLDSYLLAERVAIIKVKLAEKEARDV